MRERVLEAAEAVISTKGLAGLKARDISARAGCALEQSTQCSRISTN